MTTLSIDPATRCGFAHSDGHSGQWDLSRVPSDHPGLRLVLLYDHLMEAHATWGFDKIACEDSGFGAGGSKNREVMMFLNHLIGVVKLVACQIGVPCAMVPISSWKSWACGYGAAKPEQYTRAYETQYRVLPATADEAAALWILRYSEANVVRTRKQKKAHEKQLAARQGRLFGGRKS